MCYRLPGTEYVNYWFSTADTLDVNAFNRFLFYERIDKLEQDRLLYRMNSSGQGICQGWELNSDTQYILEYLFPTAAVVLDTFRCVESIHALAVVHYGERPDTAGSWVEATMARLFCSEGDGMRWGLKRMRPAAPEVAAIEGLIGYLHKSRRRINYRAPCKAGSLLGTGSIESTKWRTGIIRWS